MAIKKSYYSYITDSLRIYRLLPRTLRRGYWEILALQTTTAILESSTIVVMSFFFASVSSPDASRQNVLIRRLLGMLPDFASVRLQGDRSFITAMCLLMVAFIIVKNLFSGFAMSRTTRFSELLGLFISSETYARYFGKNYYWHISPESGQVLARLGHRAQLTGMATAILQFFGYSLCCLFMFASLFFFEPSLTLIMGVVFAIIGIGTYVGVRRRIDRAGQGLGAAAARESWSAGMAVRGIREIIIHRKQSVFLKHIVDAIREEVPHKAFLSFAGMLPAWFLEVGGFITIFGVMLYLVHDGRPMHEVIGSVSMLFLTAWRVLPSVSRSMGLTVHIRGLRPMALSCLELLENFAAAPGAVPVSPDPHFRFSESLELEEASFRYPGAAGDCLHSLSLRVSKGESLALVGPSGSGKSTLAMLLAGLLEPSTGVMRVDGAELTPAGREAYRQRVGYVPQNPLLLPGSIAENVALRDWGEGYDRDKVAAMCVMAAMDFVNEDPRGLDFPIGDGGQGLSAGQAQRVSIARALYTEPEVLIFDEATSSLDQASESRIAKTARQLKGKTTSVIIAHRLTSVESCDRVIWLEAGRIRAVGTPADLLPLYMDTLMETAAPYTDST